MTAPAELLPTTNGHLSESNERQWSDTVEYLRETVAELEMALEDEGWARLGLHGETEFTREGLRKIAAISRIMYLKNPLIQRAVNVKTHYVWGQGVAFQAHDPQVNLAVQRFLGDRGNKAELTGFAARMQKEVDLEVDGNLFLVFFPNIITGHVRVRSIPFDEVIQIHCNPEDRREPWLYERRWQEGTKTRRAFYPDWRYRPEAGRLGVRQLIGDVEIRWDAPVYHVRVGGLGGMRFGVPETYSALDWARAYKGFLEDLASVVKSLSKFVWRFTTQAKKIATAKTKLKSSLSVSDPVERNPSPPAGSGTVGDDGFSLETIPKAGALIPPETGKVFRLMVASATDIPDTILSGDPDQGNLATAKTLDRPTELAMRSRQSMWVEVFDDIFWYLVRSHVEATQGLLQGSVEVDVDGIETITVTQSENTEATDDGDVDVNVDVLFPPILEHDIDATVKAIVSAATLDGKKPAGTIDDKTLVRQLLSALNVDVDDALVDEIVSAMEDAAAEESAAASTDPAEDFIEAVTEFKEAIEFLRKEPVNA